MTTYMTRQVGEGSPAPIIKGDKSQKNSIDSIVATVVSEVRQQHWDKIAGKQYHKHAVSAIAGFVDQATDGEAFNLKVSALQEKSPKEGLVSTIFSRAQAQLIVMWENRNLK